MGGLHGIADGEDGGIAGPHARVDGNSAGGADLQAGLAGQFDLGPHPHGAHHQSGGQFGPGCQNDLALGIAHDPLHAVGQVEVNPRGGKPGLDDSGHLRVKGRHDLIQHLDKMGLDPPFDQILRDLHADESPADDDRLLHLLIVNPADHGVHAGDVVEAHEHRGAASFDRRDQRGRPPETGPDSRTIRRIPRPS